MDKELLHLFLSDVRDDYLEVLEEDENSSWSPKRLQAVRKSLNALIASLNVAEEEYGIEINKGDIVCIFAQGIHVTGKVVYAEHSGYWDIEMIECDIPGGYSHWKEYYDHGWITHVNGVKLNNGNK